MELPRLAAIEAELARRRMDRDRAHLDQSVEAVRDRCSRSLVEFVKEAWHVLEPQARYVHGWHIDAIAEHLEAITDGRITRLLVNVPPGSMKSMLVSVFWPAWEWGPAGLGSYRYITTTFAEKAVNRDGRRTRDLVMSEWYQKHWPMTFTRVSEQGLENEFTGWREGVAYGSLTSRRGDRLIIDDPHSVEKAESKVDRDRAEARFREGAVNRLNDQQRSAIVVIMQRLHERDISGVIMDNDMGYIHVCLPMLYESGRHCETSIGFSDPRSIEGELLCEERWNDETLKRLRSDMTEWSWAGQYQQRPVPRGGGIIGYTAWEYWDANIARMHGRAENQFPDFHLILGSVDPAYTEKKENDMTAMVVLGMWTDMQGYSKVMVMHFWQERVKLFDAVKKIVETARKFKIDRVLIENKASGMPISEEIMRQTREEEFAVTLVNPGSEDKQARTQSVSVFHREEREDGRAREGIVYVPCSTQPSGDIWPKQWADLLMAQIASFPKGKHDDGVDAYVQGMRWLRQNGWLRRRQDEDAEKDRSLLRPAGVPAPLYPGM